MRLGGRVHQHLGGGPPHRPNPKGAQREARLGRHRGYALQAPVLRLEGDMDSRAALGGYICPHPVALFVGLALRGQRTDANAVADGFAIVEEVDANHCTGTCELRVWRNQIHRQASERAMTDMHAHHGTAGQEKGEQVTQIQLVVDRRHEQHHQRCGQCEAGARGQDVHIALGQGDAVFERQTRLPPALKAGAHKAQRVQPGHCEGRHCVIRPTAPPQAWRAPAPSSHGPRHLPE